MSDHEFSILAEIDSVPDDPERRSIYADWLEERGDDRCEFVRAELELDECARATDGRRLKSAIGRLVEVGARCDPTWRGLMMRYRVSEIMVAMSGRQDAPRKRRRKRSNARQRY